ncbi:DUF6036 family nucleotidyltransferase [Thiohalomonas denitrificans]|uniref:DUF6036 domain-containing protein n=1 Tax=Thiohalomonas denitrificans TaxID=415747 RepID=A0A1G5Q911_9GAMM|nr:DUF6036 family nucleotidyltransferase [Thiohalomonas denitrificans]SCZ58108.1 hypothetical protein SAMN03097708_01606 [Thiohalomonas denitrificans]
MELTSFETITRALNDSQVRYLVVGGLAVVAHGYVRFTADVDLVLALAPENIVKAFEALEPLGYHPTVPVTAEQFANPETRRLWIEEKGMTVLNLYSDRFRGTSVDLFVNIPFNFEDEYDRALSGELVPGLTVRFVSLETLITMKERVGRPQDLLDVEHLRMILAEREKQ